MGLSGIKPGCAGVFLSSEESVNCFSLWFQSEKGQVHSSEHDTVLLEHFPHPPSLYPCEFFYSRLTTPGLACQLVALLLLQCARPGLGGSPQNHWAYQSNRVFFGDKPDFSR